ncbi:MAG TPA: ATP-binding protein, partial [Blastocatellia bacterium]|nr:ATP-binding protein [Blastocatellia bacterium]
MKLGSRFKTRLLVFSISLSLLPVIFMFFATGQLINRSVDKWFSLPARDNVKKARRIYEDYLAETLQRKATHFASRLTENNHAARQTLLAEQVSQQNFTAAQICLPDGSLITEAFKPNTEHIGDETQQAREELCRNLQQTGPAQKLVSLEEKQRLYLLAAAPITADGSEVLVLTELLTPDLAQRWFELNRNEFEYNKLKDAQDHLKKSTYIVLGLLTLFALFVSTWMALNVARSVAEPVRQLAQATERIKRGDLSGRADIVGDDELAALAQSFNEMAVELQENRQRLEQSAAALDERRHYIETILQNLSAGVISLDENRRVRTINDATLKLLRLKEAPESGSTLEALLPEEQRDELFKMLRRAARGRSVTREVHFKLANNVMLHAAVTVTAIRDPRGQSRGAVIVIEDMTELIEAQRRAAWSEVARRMAHEIKNPLTPIRLSAERLAKNLLGVNGNSANGTSDSNGHSKQHSVPSLDERSAKLVSECTSLIGAEVETLQRMVDEFSSFARLPAAKPVLNEINEVIVDTLKLYDERLEGIALHINLATELSPVNIDSEQIKRALVNLIDNALHAMNETQEPKRLEITTREISEQDAVEITVADTGPGIAPADRERVFAPYFSTRRHGTGLGLAIVSHIIAEHNGHIRVEDNSPHGAKFVIELPSAKETDEATTST